MYLHEYYLQNKYVISLSYFSLSTFRIASLFLAIFLTHHTANSSSIQHPDSTPSPQNKYYKSLSPSPPNGRSQTVGLSGHHLGDETISDLVRDTKGNHELHHSDSSRQLFTQSTTDETVDDSTTGKDSTPNFVTSTIGVILAEDYPTQKASKEITARFIGSDDLLNVEDNNTSPIDAKNSSHLNKIITPHSSGLIKLQNDFDEMLDGSRNVSSPEQVKKFESVLFVDKKADDVTSDKKEFTTEPTGKTSRQVSEFTNDETTIFQYWTTLSSDIPSGEQTERPNEKNIFKIEPESKIDVIIDNKPIRILAKPSVNISEVRNNNEEEKLVDSKESKVTPLEKDNGIELIYNKTLLDVSKEAEEEKNKDDDKLSKSGDDIVIEELSRSNDVNNSSSEESVENRLINSSPLEEDKDVLEAIDYGLNKMNQLYGVQEPMLYNMGKFTFFKSVVSFHKK